MRDRRQNREVAHLGDARGGGQRRLGGEWVGRVHDDLDGRCGAAAQVAREIVWNRDPRLGVAARDPCVERIAAVDVRHNAEIARVFEGGDGVAAGRGPRLVQHDRRDVPHVCLYRVTKEQQLDHRDRRHDAEREAVPAHLDELLAEHRTEAPHASCSCSSRSWRMMNASSRSFPPTCFATSLGEPSAIRCPWLMSAMRPQRPASSI